jgi:hypothetical protein
MTPKTRIKSEEQSQEALSTMTIADIANPLFGRAGSVNIKEEDGNNVEVLTRALSRKSRAPRQRKKVTHSKLTEVTKHLQSSLEKDPGVVVDCAFLNDGKKAAVCTLD